VNLILFLLIAPVNKYFSKAGGPSANNTEKFPGDLITSSTTIYAYSEVGTASTTICFFEKTNSNHYYSKPEPVLSITPICHDFKTGILTNSYVVVTIVRRDILLNGKRRWYFGKFFLGFFQQINLETIH
jgi:hypothetical protein